MISFLLHKQTIITIISALGLTVIVATDADCEAVDQFCSSDCARNGVLVQSQVCSSRSGSSQLHVSFLTTGIRLLGLQLSLFFCVLYSFFVLFMVFITDKDNLLVLTFATCKIVYTFFFSTLFGRTINDHFSCLSIAGLLKQLSQSKSDP